MAQPQSMFKTPAGEAEYRAAYQATLAHWPLVPEARTVDGEFGTTHVLVAGPADAPPLVVLHGRAMSATMWAANIAGLSQGHRVYAPDVMGDFGRSVATRRPRDRADHVRWLVGVLHALGLARAPLLGHSYGGWVAAAAAVAAAHRVSALALTAPAATLRSMAIWFVLRGTWAALRSTRAKARGYMGYAATKRPAHPDQHAAIIDCLAEQMYLGFKHGRSIMSAYPDVFSDQELGSIACPVLLMIGAEEVLYRPEAVIRRAEAVIPDIRTELVDDASHDIDVAQPERVNEAVLALLARASR